MSGRANIRDVADRAGVSVKTVSRVLNDHKYVGALTRQKVEAAMSDLDFRPSVAAQILAGTKSGQIALIYDNHSPYYMNRIHLGCWQRCQAEGLRLLAQPVDVTDPDIGSAVRGLVSASAFSPQLATDMSSSISRAGKEVKRLSAPSIGHASSTA